MKSIESVSKNEFFSAILNFLLLVDKRLILSGKIYSFTPVW
jgi:hypothetical protein